MNNFEKTKTAFMLLLPVVLSSAANATPSVTAQVTSLTPANQSVTHDGKPDGGTATTTVTVNGQVTFIAKEATYSTNTTMEWYFGGYRLAIGQAANIVYPGIPKIDSITLSSMVPHGTFTTNIVGSSSIGTNTPAVPPYAASVSGTSTFSVLK